MFRVHETQRVAYGFIRFVLFGHHSSKSATRRIYYGGNFEKLAHDSIDTPLVDLAPSKSFHNFTAPRVPWLSTRPVYVTLKSLLSDCRSLTFRFLTVEILVASSVRPTVLIKCLKHVSDRLVDYRDIPTFPTKRREMKGADVYALRRSHTI